MPLETSSFNGSEAGGDETVLGIVVFAGGDETVLGMVVLAGAIGVGEVFDWAQAESAMPQTMSTDEVFSIFI